MNLLIVRQMKEFSDSLPATELEHLWLNMFNYFVNTLYICVEEVFIQHIKNNKLKNRKEN